MEFDSSQLTTQSLDLGDIQLSRNVNTAGGDFVGRDKIVDDTISATIGDYAHNIAIGKQITQVFQHFHTGDYTILRDLYVSPDAVYERVHTAEFIGRHWLIARIDAFLSEPKQKCGVLVVEGEAGVGKTAVMAHLVQERNYLHLFAEQLPGDANVNRALQSLGSQIVARYQLYEYTQRDTLPTIAGFPDFLERLLRLAARKRDADEKIVIVCDSLDEAGVAANGNVFGLPAILPDGVYLLLAQRPQPVRLSFKNVTLQTIRLDPASIDNRGDVTAYLRAAARQPVVAEQLRQRGYSEDHFVTTLTERSNGIWMYLQYVIEEIGRGERAPLDLDRLPPGLAGYYAEYWSRWRDGRRGDGVEKWDTLYAPLLATLAAVQVPLPLERLLGWAGVTIHKYPAQRLLREDWRAFVTQTRRISTLSPTSASTQTVRFAQAEDYSIYHATLRDFLSGKVPAERLTFEARAVADELRQRTGEAHVRIVEQLRQQCGGDWLKLVADEYARLHLAIHLQAAGEQEPAYHKELYALVTLSNGWAQARYTKEESYAGYLVDLQRVWQQAESETSWNVKWQIRCALIQSTIFSMVGNLKPNLLRLAVETGVWSAARALAHLSQIQVEEQRGESIVQLAPHLPEGLLSEALSTAQAITNEWSRVHALSELAPHLPEALKAQAVSEALAAACAITNEASRVHALCGLAPHLPEAVKEQATSEALVATQAIANASWRADALIGLIPHLPEALKEQAVSEALATARTIADEESRARTLSALASHLPEALKVQAVSEALAAAWAITNEEWRRVHALSALASHLPEALKAQVISKALAAAQAITNDKRGRVRVLNALVPYLSEALKEQVVSEALVAARAITNEESRVHALCGLAPHLPDSLKAQAVSEALEAARTITDEEWGRVRVLNALAPHLPDSLKVQAVNEALADAQTIADETSRARALNALAPHLPDSSLNDVLVATQAIADEKSRARVLNALAPQLPEALLGRSLAAARAIADASCRAHALRGLIPYLPEALKAQTINEALATAQTITYAWGHAHALSALVPHLSEVLKIQAISEALAAVQAIANASNRVSALCELIPYLSEALKIQAISEALAAAQTVANESGRADVLRELALHLPEVSKAQVISEALTAAQAISNESGRAHALGRLASHLPTELMCKALATAQAITDEEERVSALCELAPHLPEALKAQAISEALTAAQTITYASTRTRTLRGLIPYLPEALKAQAISEALAIGDKSIRAKALSDIVLNLSRHQQLAIVQDVFSDLARSHWSQKDGDGRSDRTDSLHNLITCWRSIQFEGFIPDIHWLPVLRSLSRNQRNEFQHDLAELIPLIEHLGGQVAMIEMLRALRDVAAWWP